MPAWVAWAIVSVLLAVIPSDLQQAVGRVAGAVKDIAAAAPPPRP